MTETNIILQASLHAFREIRMGVYGRTIDVAHLLDM